MILLIAAFVRLYHIEWSFSNNGIDEGIMIQRARLVGEGYSLYSELPCDQAPLAFFLGAPFGGDVVSLRTISAVLSVLAIAAVMETARRVKGNFAMIAAGLLVSLDFVFLRESRLFSLDGISASFLAFSLVPFVVYIQRRSRLWLAAAGLLVGLSAATKLFGVLALLGMIAYIAYEGRKENTRPRCIVISAALLTFFSAIPLAVFMSYFGPSDVFNGMVLDQGGRSFEPWLKLSLPAYFGLNIAYAIPLVLPRRTWAMNMEVRFLLILSVAILAFMIIQPLVFLHHLALLSPPLAILAGVVVSEALRSKKDGSNQDEMKKIAKKKDIMKMTAVASICVMLFVSGGLAGYGLVSQREPPQIRAGDNLKNLVGEDGWVISGDPLICAYADRNIPPELVNVAYRQHDDITLEDIEYALENFDVSVVVVVWRLQEIEGIDELLAEHSFTMLSNEPPLWPDGWDEYLAKLDFFQDEMGAVEVWWRSTA